MSSSSDPADVLKRLYTVCDSVWRTLEIVSAEEVDGHRDLTSVCKNPYRSDPEKLPPGFAAALTMRAVLAVLHDATLDLPFDLNVHAEQDLRWFEPLRVGLNVVTEARIGDVRRRSRSIFFDVLTETRSTNDGLHLCGTSTQAIRYV